MKKTVVQLTLRRWEEIYTDPRIYVLFFMFVIGFTVISPLGLVEDRSRYERFSLSLMGNSVCWPIALLITPAARIVIEQLGARRELALFFSCVITGAVVIPLLLWVLQNEFSTLPDITIIIELYAFLVVLIFVTGYAFMRNKYFSDPIEIAQKSNAGSEAASDENTLPQPNPKCLGVQERIPAHKRGVIYAMIAQDHYVEVITDKGSELVLMRLSDAISMCEKTNCMRIHRSAWVSFEGVKEIKKQGRKMLVIIPGGRELPVARSAENRLKRYLKAKSSSDMLPA